MPFSAFHDTELVDHTEAALDGELFDAWLESGQSAPSPDQCVGYRIPLFLGGAHEVSNLETTDLDVYWSLFGQMRESSHDAHDRTPVARVTMDGEP